MAAWVFYVYVRIRYTLTGGIFPYAITILVFEFISSSSMVVHGLSLLRRRVPRKIDPASPPPPREYIIRVSDIRARCLDCWKLRKTADA